MEKRNPVGWFEIPVTDMQRAKSFYETVMKTEFKEENMGDTQMFFFPHSDTKGAGGALIKNEGYKPSSDGVLIYFTSPTSNLKKEGEVVVNNGGKILVPVKSVGEYGYVTILLDTEGNRFALHTRGLKEE